MASSLSEEEFQRMQMQLIELRTSNYSLEDKCAKHERELTSLRATAESTQKDLDKATKSISKSKKAKEFELLMQENDSLQRKLMSQEDEFRLQNETLMHELNRLVTVNENLETDNKNLVEKQHNQSGSLSASGGETAAESSATQAEITHLQALNSALQKNLQESKDKYEAELSRLREPVTEGKRTEGDGAPVEASSDVAPESSKQEIDSLMQKINDLQLNTDVEKEENRLLREQLETSKKETSEQIKTLQEEVEKLGSKFKKKQESFVQLQDEKERQYGELTGKLEELHKAKDAEVAALHSQCERLHTELARANKQLEDYRTENEGKVTRLEEELRVALDKVKQLEEQERSACQRVQELEEMCASLEEEVDEGNAEQQQEMEAELGKMQRKLQQTVNQLDSARNTIDDLNVQLKESRSNHAGAIEQLTALQEDRDKQIQALQEVHRVAEKRKGLLDEMAIKYQSESDHHRATTQGMTEEHARTVDNMSSQMAQLKKSMEEKHAADVAELSMEISALKVKAGELVTVKEELEELRTEHRSVVQAKEWLERRLAEVEENFAQSTSAFEEQLSTKDREHESNITELKETHKANIEEVQQKINVVNEDKVQLEASVQQFKQEIKDGVDARKIHEKKGMTVVRDLKKQLVSERKRAEKLQERLQDLLSDSRSRQSVEELLRSGGAGTDTSSFRGDDSSISSWSGVSKEQSAMSGGSPDEEDAPSTSLLEQENTDLLQRLAEQQQISWSMEEKVSHLESSNAAMAEDLLGKTAIIEHYVMESRTSSTSTTQHNHLASSPSQEKISFKRMMDFVKGENDDNMKDMNRKLQRMLEETLTKNMHLQQDMETLSQEVVRLSKASS